MRETHYTFEETCKILEIKSRTLSRWVKDRKIPCYKIGKRKWFRKSELESWIDGKKNDV